MSKNLKIVIVDSDYCDYLREFDNKIPFNKFDKANRPFIGVLFNIDTIEYFAPLSSPKEKHKKMKNTIDFQKIDDGNLGAINFNNMIPVKNGLYELVDLNTNNVSLEELKYKYMLKQQLTWINKNVDQIKSKGKKLYDLYYLKRLPDSIYNRCCDYKLLEEKCKEYDNM